MFTFKSHGINLVNLLLPFVSSKSSYHRHLPLLCKRLSHNNGHDNDGTSIDGTSIDGTSIGGTSIGSTSIEHIINDRSFTELSLNDFKSLASDNEKLKMIETILSQYDYHKFINVNSVPSTLTLRDMKELLLLNHSKRKEYLMFAFKREIMELKNNMRKEIQKDMKRNELNEKWAQIEVNGRTGLFDIHHNVVYGLHRNTLFTRISKSSVRRYSNNNLINAAKFGDNIIIDMSFHNEMSRKEMKMLINEIGRTYSENRIAINPFHFYFSNVNFDSDIYELMRTQILQHFEKSHFIATVTDKSFLDLFPNNQLCYVTPHASEDLIDYNHNYTYIFPGIFNANLRNDQRNKLFNYRTVGIRSVRIPFDNYIVWRSGGVNSIGLHLNNMIGILRDSKNGVKFGDAIKNHVPKYRIKTEKEIQSDDIVKIKSLAKKFHIKNIVKQLDL